MLSVFKNINIVLLGFKRKLLSDNCCYVDGASSKKVCSYQEVVDHLNLTTDNSVLKLTRPVLDYTHPTVVELDILLYAILAVVGSCITLMVCGSCAKW